MVCERPTVIQRELATPTLTRGWRSHRLHCDTGPAVAWPDGWGVWASHGIRVPQHVIEAPQTITVREIHNEQNAEVRRVMVERMGFDRFVKESGALPLHGDETGTLYRLELSGDDPLMLVSVLNSTLEQNQPRKQYFLQVDPQLRPLPNGAWDAEKKRDWIERQEPQAITARNAVASTFGLRGEQYQPAHET